MKKFFVLLFTIVSYQSIAQQPLQLFKDSTYFDGNNFKMPVNVHGSFWHLIDSINTNSACMYNKGGYKGLGYTFSLWMGGYDANNVLHAAATSQVALGGGAEYWPGPLQGADTNISYALSQDWAKVWKINKSDIQTFLATSTHTLTNTPTVILEWPAKGNVYAKGRNGATLYINDDMAPFIDVNNDGYYNALQGDYPKMKGDQMLWLVYNDAGPAPHNEITNAPSLGVEVRAMIYGYKNFTSIDNLMFYEFQLRNKKATLNSFTVGSYVDIDLGDPNDDYVGYDSSRNMGYFYNSDMMDSIGYGIDYHDSIPMVAITMLEFPGRTCNQFMPLGSFMYIRNSNNTIYGNPHSAQDVYGSLTHTWRDGSAAKAPSGTNYDGYNGTGQNVKYVYDGKNGWTMCNTTAPPAEYKMVMSITPQTFHKDSSMKLAFALVATERLYQNGCPNQSFTALNNAVDLAQIIYCNPITSTINNTSLIEQEIKIFPNPATNEITIHDNMHKGNTIQIYNAVGQKVLQPMTCKENEMSINISSLSSGFYMLQISTPEKNTTLKFFKN